jgi:hypothetical protein
MNLQIAGKWLRRIVVAEAILFAGLSSLHMALTLNAHAVISMQIYIMSMNKNLISISDLASTLTNDDYLGKEPIFIRPEASYVEYIKVRRSFLSEADKFSENNDIMLKHYAIDDGFGLKVTFQRNALCAGIIDALTHERSDLFFHMQIFRRIAFRPLHFNYTTRTASFRREIRRILVGEQWFDIQAQGIAPAIEACEQARPPLTEQFKADAVIPRMTIKAEYAANDPPSDWILLRWRKRIEDQERARQ